MFGFPVPVSNKTIPRGWFAALVRFMNSLLLRGDGRYFAVTHTTEGTTIKPTPALIQALERSGGAAPSAGGGGGGIQVQSWLPEYVPGHYGLPPPEQVPVTTYSGETPLPSQPTAAMIYKPPSDGWFYWTFFMTNQLQHSNAGMNLYIYYDNPYPTRPAYDPKVFYLKQVYYPGIESGGGWFPAAQKCWFIFTMGASFASDLEALHSSVYFYPTQQ